MFSKSPRWSNKKYRDAAKGQPCTMRLPGICNNNPETTVLAHRNGAGMAYKASDHDAAEMCSACHDAFDGRTRWPEGIDKAERFERARLVTITGRIERGVLKCG